MADRYLEGVFQGLVTRFLALDYLLKRRYTMMDILRQQKFFFDNGYLLLFLMMLLSSNVRAGGMDSNETEMDNQSLIHDVTYDYQLISDNNSGFDCIGTLHFSVSLPTDINTLFFERTKRHTIVDSPDDLFFSAKSEYPITTTDISKPDIYWGTYFRICAVLKNNQRIYSATYSVDEYIDSSDLELLLPQYNSILATDAENVSISIRNKQLEIVTQEPIELSIFDLSGLCIFNKEIQISERIPLHDVTSHFLIVRYKTSNNTVTKKLFLR